MANLSRIYEREMDDIPDAGEAWTVQQWETFMRLQWDRVTFLEQIRTVTKLPLPRSASTLDTWISALKGNRTPTGEAGFLVVQHPTERLPREGVLLQEDWILQGPNERPSIQVVGKTPRVEHGWHSTDNTKRPIFGLFQLIAQDDSITEVHGARSSYRKYGPPTQHTIHVCGDNLLSQIGETEVVGTTPDSLAPLILLGLDEGTASRIIEKVGNVAEAKIMLRFLALLQVKYGKQIPDLYLNGDKTALLANNILVPKKFKKGERSGFFAALRIAYESGWQPK
ncbi:MAG: hypothetical protein PHZ00_04120 [Candidatus Peribacteraceae bacterium]|nr:hypothetical protein [Candidatus Peribacteraceae bacterium]